MNLFRLALTLFLPLLLVVLTANRLTSQAEDNVLPLRPVSDQPLATIGLRHPLPDHPHGFAAPLAACDKDIDLTSTIAGVTAIAAQNNIICTTGEIDLYEQGDNLYAVQAAGQEAAFTITQIASNGTPTLITQKYWQQANTYTADIKAFKQGDSRYIALSLERLASGAACGVVIINVTDPANITSASIVDQVSGIDWCDVHNAVVENDANGDGKYLYLTADAPNDMRILDIGNLSNITEIGRYTHPDASNDNYVHDITVIDHGGAIGRRVYVSYWAAGLMILNAAQVTPGVIEKGSVNQPLNPNYSIDPAGFLTHDAHPSHDGTLAFIEDEFLDSTGTQPVQMWDISSPSAPQYLDGVPLGSPLMPVRNPAHNLLVQGHCLYVGWYKAGLQAFAFTNTGFTSRPIYHQAQTEASDDRYDGAWNVELANRGSLALIFQSDRRYGLIVDAVNSALDTDGDGFGDAAELRLGTDSCRACAADTTADNEEPDPQSEDFNDDTFITAFDLNAVAGDIGKLVPPGPARKDIAPEPPDGAITAFDLNAVAGLIGRKCTP